MIIPIPTSLPRSSSIDQTISMHKTTATILVQVKELINTQDYGYFSESERARGSDVGNGIIISSMTKQAGNNVNPTWPFYFDIMYVCAMLNDKNTDLSKNTAIKAMKRGIIDSQLLQYLAIVLSLYFCCKASFPYQVRRSSRLAHYTIAADSNRIRRL